MRDIIIKKKCLLFKHEKKGIKPYPMTGRLIVTRGYMLNRLSIIYKNVDIKFSAHDAFLELPCTLKIEILESQII